MRHRSLLASLVATVLWLGSSPAHAALPSESPADTFQVDGPRVRSVAIVDDNVWLAGRFSELRAANGSKVQDVANLAVVDRSSGEASTTAQPLRLAGVSNAEVWKLATDGSTVYAAGKFTLGSDGKTYRNLIAFDGRTGALIGSFRPLNTPVLQSITAGADTVYAGGRKLVAVDASTGATTAAFTTSTVETDLSLRPGHNTPPQHRDLQILDGYLYSACSCDSLTQEGRTRGVKALVRFDLGTGLHDERFAPEAMGKTATGISVATDGTDLYLGGGGSDFVARYSPTLDYGGGATFVGRQWWKRDTSGSTQAVEVSGSDLVVGGHFVEMADDLGDNCGFRSTDPATLDPDGECAARNRLASYTLGGALQAWDPSVTGKYNGVWGLALDGATIHVGGEFTKVHGIAQTHYARLDP
jgi:hypothetical protein